MTKYVVWVAVVAALMVGHGAALAQETSPFARGIAEFEQGRYGTAKAEFEAAVRDDPAFAEAFLYLGLASLQAGDEARAASAFDQAATLDPALPGVHRSLGIALFRIEAYGRARRAFDEALTRDPNDGTALYFSGLSRQAEGDHTGALPYFDRAVRASPELRQQAMLGSAVSLVRLDRLDAARRTLRQTIAENPETDLSQTARELLDEVDERLAARKPWTVTASAGFQFDDNVTTDEIDVTSGQSDIAGVFEFGGEYRLVDTDDTSVEVAYDFSQTLYQDLTDFDLQTHGLYIAGSREWRGVDLGLSYQYSRVYLGGDDFLGIHSVSPSVGFSPADRWYTVVAYNYQNKNFIDTSARDAGRHDFGGTAFYVLTDSGALVSLGYEVQSENANGPAFDYFGQEVAFRAIAPYSILTRPVTFEFEYVYWNRDYRNITPSIGAERDDDRHRFRVDASTPVHEYFDFVLSYELINSNSNLPSNDFSENIVTVSVKAEY